MLINGGSSVSTLSDELGRRLSTFNRKLDWLVVAATEEQDVAALPRVLERYPPDEVLWSGNTAGVIFRGSVERLFVRAGPYVTIAEPGQVLDLGDGANMRVLTTGPRGAILLIEWKSFRALLPIGMSFDAMDELHDGASVGQVSLFGVGRFWLCGFEST